MRRVRRDAGGSADSLELLLDTICNTFGGIVFIALLVVLLLQNVSPPTTEAAAESITPEDAERAAARLHEAVAELAALRTAAADMARRAEAFAPAEVRGLVSDRNALAEQAAAARTARDRQAAENAATAAAVVRQDAEIAAAADGRTDAEQSVAALEAKLEAVRKSKAKEIRNPVVRESSFPRSVGLIVRYGRMYVWHRYAEDGERLGLNTDEFVVVSDDGDRLVTRPDPTKGIPLRPGAATAALARLRTFPPRTTSVTVIVRSDSFEQFAVLRDALISAGYSYRLIPGDDEIVDRGGSDDRVQ